MATVIAVYLGRRMRSSGKISPRLTPGMVMVMPSPSRSRWSSGSAGNAPAPTYLVTVTVWLLIVTQVVIRLSRMSTMPTSLFTE